MVFEVAKSQSGIYSVSNPGQHFHAAYMFPT